MLHIQCEFPEALCTLPVVFRRKFFIRPSGGTGRFLLTRNRPTRKKGKKSV
jgi:hypothetical protein